MKQSLIIKETTFKDLFTESDRKLVIPEYQRPYVWDTGKVNDLIQDFQDFFENIEHQTQEYYLGYILLFENVDRNQYEVIDGQQRLTTLLILQYLLEKSLPQNGSITYNSQISINHIVEVRDYLKNRMDEIKRLHSRRFLEKLRLTVITTQIADNAFTFFDTQNNRAVKLGATDFLKAYHLRSIKSEKMQDNVAQSWESNNDSALTELFSKILWRSRNWKGTDVNLFKDREKEKEEILKTFQKKTQKDKTLADCSYPLYHNSKNRMAIRQKWTENGEVELTTMQMNNKAEIDFPFALRQPIYDGLNFFHYTQKYIAIKAVLFNNEIPSNSEISKMRAFYDSVYNNDMSIYLRQFLQLCLVMYYDCFGEQRLTEAAYYFDYLIGESRINKKLIKQESIKLILTGNTINVLDVIVQAYLPIEIFDFIDNLPNIDSTYDRLNLIDEAEKSVRTKYVDRLISYFKPSDKSLKFRKQWHKKTK